MIWPSWLVSAVPASSVPSTQRVEPWRSTSRTSSAGISGSGSSWCEQPNAPTVVPTPSLQPATNALPVTVNVSPGSSSSALEVMSIEGAAQLADAPPTGASETARSTRTSQGSRDVMTL